MTLLDSIHIEKSRTGKLLQEYNNMLDFRPDLALVKAEDCMRSKVLTGAV